MINFIYKKSSDTKATIRNEFSYGAWVHTENPDDEELNYLTDAFDLDKSLLTDALDVNEVPRLEREPGAVYLFTRCVIQVKEQFFTTPLVIIFKKKVIVTIAPRAIPQLDNFISSNRSNWTSYDPEALFLNLLMLVNQSAEKALTMTSRFIQQSRIQVEKIRNKKLLEFIDIENSLYDISALLVRMETIVSGVIAKPFFRLTEEQEEVLKDIYLAIQQMSDIVKANIRTVVNTRDAISTIMTANLNRVIKLFTSLTVLLTVPMMVGTFYGMNVRLPLADSPNAFVILLGGTLVVSAGLLLVFAKKDWL